VAPSNPVKGYRHWRIYHWATWAMPPLWAVDRKCSKLKISHTAVIAARVVKQRRQRDSIWFVHETVKNTVQLVAKQQQLQHHLHGKTSCFGLSTVLQNIFSLQQLTASPIFSV